MVTFAFISQNIYDWDSWRISVFQLRGGDGKGLTDL